MMPAREYQLRLISAIGYFRQYVRHVSILRERSVEWNWLGPPH
ncbi:hypothetical protein [Paenibacillus lautus]